LQLGLLLRRARPQVKAGITIKALVALGIFLAVLWAPLPGSLPAEGQRVLAVVALAVVLWITELLPASITGLLAVVLLVLLGGVADVETALSGFASPVVYFLIGILTLGLGVHKSGLAERVARVLVAWVGGSPRLLFGQMVLSFIPMAFLLPSATTRNAILIHVYEGVLSQWQIPRRDPLAKAVMLGLGSLNRLASTALLTGGVAPIAAAALLGVVGWWRWFVLLSVPYYTLLLAGGLALYFWYRRGFKPTLPPIPASHAAPWNWLEIRAAGIATLAVALWFTDSLHHLPPTIPALTAMVLLLTPKIGVLTWAEFERDMGWAPFIILATSLSLANAMVASGVARWLADGIEVVVAPVTGSPVGVVMVLMLAATAIRLVIPNIVGFLALVVPVAMSVATILGLNPLVCGLAVLIAGDAIVLYPVAGPATLIVYARGNVRGGEIFRFGLVMMVVSYVVVGLVALSWWSLIGEPLMP